MQGHYNLFTKSADHYTITLDLYKEAGGLPLRVMVVKNDTGEAHFIAWCRTQIVGYSVYEEMAERYDI